MKLYSELQYLLWISTIAIIYANYLAIAIIIFFIIFPFVYGLSNSDVETGGYLLGPFPVENMFPGLPL